MLGFLQSFFILTDRDVYLFATGSVFRYDPGNLLCCFVFDGLPNYMCVFYIPDVAV